MIATRLTAVDVLQQHLERFRLVGGGQSESICPFPDHKDSNPSFRVNIDVTSPRYLRWLCNGCGKRGYGRTLLEHLLGTQDALVDELLPQLTMAPTELVRRAWQSQQTLPEAVLILFADYDLDYLLGCGFSQETLDKYEVGYDGTRDAFTYPIRDIRGRLTGIYRRNPDDPSGKKASAKYLPYGARDFPDGLIPHGYAFIKSENLWGAHMEVQRPTRLPLIVVEGFKAAMWLSQHIGENYRVVGAYGTAFSARQVQLAGMLGSPITYFLFDNRRDAAWLARRAAKTMRDEGYPAVALTDYPTRVPQPDDIPPQLLKELFP